MTQPNKKSAMRLGELVSLAATIMSMVALSIDAMLPALSIIGSDLGAKGSNDAQLIVASVLLGLGVGQFLYGPLSDSVGRKPAIYVGMAIFMIGCVLSVVTTGFQLMLLGRLMQGFGAAAPRVVMVALVRDQYEGRAMARVMSFIMAVFILVPVLAPSFGQGILFVASWRAIFASFLVIAAVGLTWFAIRQPETLPPAKRAPFSLRRIAGATREICTTRATIGYTVAAGFIFGPFIGYLSSAQQVFQEIYGTGTWFSAYFGALAVAIGAGGLINGRLVLRFGMRPMAKRATAAAVAISAILGVVAYGYDGVPPLWLFMGFFAATFLCIGMLFGNLNALAMEPLGHIAGVGAAIVGALSTLIAVPIGALIGRAYDGTVTVLVGSFVLFTALSLAMMLWVDRGPQARSPNKPGTTTPEA